MKPRRPSGRKACSRFKLSQGDVREKVHAWYRSRWFAPNRFKSRAFTDTIHGLYLPYWTFDAQVAAQWTAEAGFHYYTTENYTDSKGNSQTRQVQHTRWEYASGALEHFFDDELVPASRGVPPELLRRIEPFPTKQLAPYDAGYVSGWVVEQYQIDLVAAAKHSREAMDAKLRQLCAQQVPGDTQRGLAVQADYSAQTFKHILLPVWLLTYQYGAKTFRIAANGFTGTIAGKYPKSWIKIGLLVLRSLHPRAHHLLRRRRIAETTRSGERTAAGVLVAAFCGDELRVRPIARGWPRAPKSSLRQNAGNRRRGQRALPGTRARTSRPGASPWSSFAPSCACPGVSPACSRRTPSR